MRSGAPVGTATPGVLAGSSSTDEPLEELEISSTTLTEREAAEASEDPDQVAIRDMPVTLIAPTTQNTDGGDGGDGGDGDDGGADALPQPNANVIWGVQEVLGDAPTNHDGSDVKVAVLDTGINPDHPAFAGINITQKNFTEEEDDNDRNGHGTHCAGTVFGRDVDGLRFGVAQGVSNVLIGKVLDQHGDGSAGSVLEALEWARNAGADIISMSLGFDYPGLQRRLQDAGNPPELATSKALKAYRDNLDLFRTLIEYLAQETGDRDGSLIVSASGNESKRDVNPDFVIDVSVPAAASQHVVSVGATKLGDGAMDIAPFSNINPVLCAPGVDILSASHKGGLRLDSGTSMACPHVAGVAALWWQWTKENIGIARASIVRSNLVARASLENLDGDLGLVDRGSGCVLAPQA